MRVESYLIDQFGVTAMFEILGNTCQFIFFGYTPTEMRIVIRNT